MVYQIVRLADVLGEIGATKGYAGATISIFWENLLQNAGKSCIIDYRNASLRGKVTKYDEKTNMLYPADATADMRPASDGLSCGV